MHRGGINGQFSQRDHVEVLNGRGLLLLECFILLAMCLLGKWMFLMSLLLLLLVRELLGRLLLLLQEHMCGLTQRLLRDGLGWERQSVKGFVLGSHFSSGIFPRVEYLSSE